jgi:hypothetical protein
MNLKNLSFGLVMTGLGVVVLTAQAQAYEFNFLGSNNNTYNFEFVTEGPDDDLVVDNELIITGFTGISDIQLTAPINNVAGVLPASFAFKTTSYTSDTAIFTANANLSGIERNTPYQTFSITAAGVPSNFVTANFGGNTLDPTPVPEPLTILGTLAALGFGSRCQKEFAKKQSANSEEA